MAFRDTSERYEYIYGSNVKKLDRETAGSTKSGSTKRAGNNVLSAWNRTVECNGKADFRFKDREGNITQQAECNKSRD